MSDNFKKTPSFTKEKAEILRRNLAKFDDKVEVDPLSLEESTDFTSLKDRTFLLHILIETLCCLVESDEYKRKQLFNRICEGFEANNVIHSAINLDSLAESRRRSALQFYEHIKKVHQNINHPPNEQIYEIEESDIPISKIEKYDDTFDEIGVIAHGGFGTVCKARHKVDSAIYAVKKIIFEYKSDLDYIKVMREVRNLSSLSNKYVVAYNNAWIQPVNQQDANSKKPESPSDYTEDQSTEDSCDDQSVGDSSVAFVSYSNNQNKFSTCNESSSSSTQNDPDESQSSLNTMYNSELNRSSSSNQSISIVFQNSSNSDLNINQNKSLETKECQPKIPELPILRIKMMLCIQMEYCDFDLRHWLDARNAGGPLLFSKSVRDIFKEIVCGVAYIHDKGIIHRDLKPQNIFFSKEKGIMKVGDFGLATLGHNPSDKEQGSLTHSTNLGTVPYAAPEQRANSNYDSKVDMYSLGIILIELLVNISTKMELGIIIENSKKGLFPKEIIEEWPEYVPLLSNLLSEKCANRMHAKQVLAMPLFKDKEGSDLEQKVKDMETDLASKEKEFQDQEQKYQKQILIMEQKFQEEKKAFEALIKKISDLEQKVKDMERELANKEKEFQEQEQKYQKQISIMEQKFQEEKKAFEEALIKKISDLEQKVKDMERESWPLKKRNFMSMSKITKHKFVLLSKKGRKLKM